MKSAAARSRKARWVVWTLVGLGGVLLFTAGVGYALWSASPAHWRVVDADDEEVKKAAGRFERSTVSRLTHVRPPEKAWRLVLEQRPLNRWLATRLPQWLRNQGIEIAEELENAVEQRMVAFRRDHVVVAAKLTTPDLSQILSLRYTPTVTDDGLVRLTLDGMYAGRLPLPRAAVEGLLENYAQGGSGSRPTAKEILRALEKVDLELPLRDGRKVRVTGIELRKGKAILTCRTAPATQTGPPSEAAPVGPGETR